MHTGCLDNSREDTWQRFPSKITWDLLQRTVVHLSDENIGAYMSPHPPGASIFFYSLSPDFFFGIHLSPEKSPIWEIPNSAASARLRGVAVLRARLPPPPLHRRRPTPPRNSPTPDPNADQLLHPPPCLILLFPHRLRRPSPPPPSIAASAVAPLDLFFPHSAHPHLSHHPPGWGILHLQAFLYPPRLHWYLCFFFYFLQFSSL